MRNPLATAAIAAGAAAIAATTVISVNATQPADPHLSCVDQVRNLVGAMKPSSTASPEEWIGDFNAWLVGYVNSDRVGMDAAQENLNHNTDADRVYTKRMAHARTLAARALDQCKAEAR